MYKKDLKCEIEYCENKQFAKGLCGKHRMAARRAANPELRKKSVAYTKAWKAANKEKHAAQQARKHEKYKYTKNTYTAKWKRDNWESYKHYLYARKQRVKQATPKWADVNQIEEFYRNCPKGCHVDHIVPINGKDRSGLHVIDNLQYLSASENLKKSNNA